MRIEKDERQRQRREADEGALRAARCHATGEPNRHPAVVFSSQQKTRSASCRSACPCRTNSRASRVEYPVDAHARVLRDTGEPIVGLYARGSCTGGPEGRGGAHYFGALINLFGLIAAAHMAATK